MSAHQTTAYFVGGPADGQTRDFDGLPPDRMQAICETQAEFDEFGKSTLYTRNDLTGGIVMYVPMGSLLHDAFQKVLHSYADAAKEKAHG